MESQPICDENAKSMDGTVEIPWSGGILHSNEVNCWLIGSQLSAACVYKLKNDGDRITAITWRMDVKPGEIVEFSFVARKPRDKTQLV